MKKTTIVLFGIMVFASLQSASAVTLETGTTIEPSDSNTIYVMDNALSFTNVLINDNAPYFNGSIFQIEPDSGSATVNISRWQPPDMEFEITATDNVEITLGGFIAYKHYIVFVDGNRYGTFFNANAMGIIYFNYNSWSTHLFTIEKYVSSTEGGKGEIPGYIPIQYDYTNGDELEETGFICFVFAGLVLLGFALFIIIIVSKKKKK